MHRPDWRTAAADALDAQASAIAVALTELDNVHAILEAHRRADSCHELRALAARLRSEASTFSGEARQLRLAAPDPDRRRDGMPLALTVAATSHHSRRVK